MFLKSSLTICIVLGRLGKGETSTEGRWGKSGVQERGKSARLVTEREKRLSIHRSLCFSLRESLEVLQEDVT